MTHLLSRCDRVCQHMCQNHCCSLFLCLSSNSIVTFQIIDWALFHAEAHMLLGHNKHSLFVYVQFFAVWMYILLVCVHRCWSLLDMELFIPLTLFHLTLFCIKEVLLVIIFISWQLRRHKSICSQRREKERQQSCVGVCVGVCLLGTGGRLSVWWVTCACFLAKCDYTTLWWLWGETGLIMSLVSVPTSRCRQSNGCHLRCCPGFQSSFHDALKTAETKKTYSLLLFLLNIICFDNSSLRVNPSTKTECCHIVLVNSFRSCSVWFIMWLVLFNES